jgi:hypothetical protein
MRRSLGIDPKRPFTAQTLIARHLHLLIDCITQRFGDVLTQVKLPPSTARIRTVSGNGDVLGVHFR